MLSVSPLVDQTSLISRFFKKSFILFLILSFSGVFFLGGISLAKFTGPDWPVRGSSLDVTRDPVLLVSDKGKTA